MKVIRFVVAKMGLTFAMMVALTHAAEKPLPKLTKKDFSVVPYCTVATDKKLDPDSKDIFDALKVTVTAGQETRYRISGKKDEDAGNLEGRPVLHFGKLVLAPADIRNGTVNAKLPTVIDVRSYFMCLEYGEGKLKSEYLKLEAKEIYKWSIEQNNGETTFEVFRLKDGQKESVAKVSAPQAEAGGFGFAATVRWKGNEADLAVTFD